MLNYIIQDFCKDPYVIPCKYNCLWSDILCEYINLINRYKNSVTNNEHIWQLSQPKLCTVIYKKKDYRCKDKYPMVNLINKADQMENTRTEMLSYPHPRKLLQLKEHGSFKNFHPKRKSRVNRLIRKSLLSLYSHLAGVQPPQRPRYRKISNYALSESFLARLSMPKKDASKQYKESEQKETEGPKRGSLLASLNKDKPTFNKKRLLKLAKPKVIVTEEPFEKNLKETKNNFISLENLQRLAKPKFRTSLYEEKPKTLDLALKYKASKRIEELAKPTKVYQKETQVDADGKTSYEKMRLSLKAKPNQRIITLATPKSYTDINTRQNPYKVKKAALAYKATDRIKKLATPKEVN